jgi:hypothetical protein
MQIGRDDETPKPKRAKKQSLRRDGVHFYVQLHALPGSRGPFLQPPWSFEL